MKEWYSNSWNYAIKKLNVDVNRGLDNDSIEERKNKFGSNRIIYGKSANLTNIIISRSRQLWVLFAMINFVVLLYNKSYGSSVFIVAAVVGILAFQITSIFKNEKKLEILKKLDNLNTKVIRGGKTVILPSEEVVVGDIVRLQENMTVPADLRIIETEALKVNESSITGEDYIVEKFETKIDYKINSLSGMKNMLFKGSKIVGGSGIGVVTSTGMETQIVNIIKFLSQENKNRTSIITQLNSVLNFFSVLGFVASALLGLYAISQKARVNQVIGVFGNTLMVTFPYGVIIIYIIGYVILVKKVNTNGILVNSLSSINNIADISLILINKLGSISEFTMEVSQIYTNDNIYPASQQELLKEYSIERIIHNIILCNNSAYDEVSQLTNGDLAEVAFLKFAGANDIYRGIIEKEQPRIFEIPFDSQKKIMTTVNRVEENYRAYVKGTVDSVLSLCTHIMIDGVEREITDEDVEKAKGSDMKMASEGLNVTAIAYRNFNYQPSASENIESHLVFVGLVGVDNPVKKNALELLKKCRLLKVKPVIMSDDNKLTAYSVGKRLGMSPEIENVISDVEINNMDFDEFQRNVSKISVFSKLSDENKNKVVSALRENGEQIAFAGYSFTELPALSNAHIDIAAGEKCSTMLKSICDINIIDNFLHNTLNLVSESRKFLISIKECIWFVTFCIFAQLSVVISTYLSGVNNSLNGARLLIIDFILIPLTTILIILRKDKNESKYEKIIFSPKVISEYDGLKAIVYSLIAGCVVFAACFLQDYLKVGSDYSIDFICITLSHLIYYYYLNKEPAASKLKTILHLVVYLGGIILGVLL